MANGSADVVRRRLWYRLYGLSWHGLHERCETAFEKGQALASNPLVLNTCSVLTLVYFLQDSPVRGGEMDGVMKNGVTLYFFYFKLTRLFPCFSSCHGFR